MDKDSFKDVDWKAHKKAIRKVGSPLLKKILWSLNPSRQKLYQSKQHPSPLCPLCGEIDTHQHYITCSSLNCHTGFQDILAMMQTEGHRKQIPDHFIRTLTDAIRGLNKCPRRQPDSLRQVYEAQARIGWGNFIRGRLSKAWGKTKPKSRARMTPSEWVRVLTSHVLELVREKWEFRCRIYKDANETNERKILQMEANALWTKRAEVALLAQDRYLLAERNRPRNDWNVERIRVWVQTMTLAIDAARLVFSTQKNTLRKWLNPA